MSWELLLLIFPLVCTYQVPQTISSENFAELIDSYSQDLKRCKVVYYKSRGLGCQLTQDVNPYDTVAVSYPQQSITGLSQFLFTPYLQNFTHIEKLAARILYEKYMGDRDNLVKKYVDSLPVKSLGDFNWWKESDKQLLQEVVYFDYVESLHHMVDYYSSYIRFNSTFYSFQEIPNEILQEDAYKWAWSMIQSRAFSLSIFELNSAFGVVPQQSSVSYDENIPVMISVLDLMNHYPRPINSTNLSHKILDVELTPFPTFVLKADRYQKSGDEFVFRYGVKNNYSLLVLYGFVIEESSDDYFLYSTDKFPRCYEKRSPDGYCNFLMFPYTLHFKFYRHLRETTSGLRVNHLDSLSELYKLYTRSPEVTKAPQESKESLLSAGLLYRHLIKPKRKDSIPLRILRRQQFTFKSPTERQIYIYGIESRRAFWQHMRCVDKLLMKFYKLSLHI